MFSPDDPRAKLASGERNLGSEFGTSEFGRFYQEKPSEEDERQRTWWTRGQNFVVGYSATNDGATFERPNQLDEYMVLLPNRETDAKVTVNGRSFDVPGYSVSIVAPGQSSISIVTGGPVIRVFSALSADLMELSSNRESYAIPHPNVRLFEPWPESTSRQALRTYSLDVPPEAGRFGRIWSCSTLMVNFINPRIGPRDTATMSPHSHDDFEQCSVVLEGAYIHHIRRPWTTSLASWRDDEHELCAAPSIVVIASQCVHTSQAVGEAANQIIDIFCPPRSDFREEGWVLNAEDYPSPR